MLELLAVNPKRMHRARQNMGAICTGCYACSILDLIWIKVLEALHLTD